MIRDLIALENTSKVWIYQSDRDLTYDELDIVRPQIFEFLESWTSHNHQLMTYGNVFHLRFLAFFVDETHAGASGCSIDKSVHFVTTLGQAIGVDFFNRDQFAYLQDDEVQFIKMSALKVAYDNGAITDDTLFFDNLVKNKEAFLKKWLVPLRDAWHKKFVQ